MPQHTALPLLSPSRAPRSLSRRTVLGAGLSGAALVTLAACAPSTRLVSPGSGAVTATEAARDTTGKVSRFALRAAPSELDLAGTPASTWSYGTIPGPQLRVTAGDTMRVTLDNSLPEDTTIHWHGLALRNDMDGVPNLTQDTIATRSEFTYEFVAPHPGTYWFHPHEGTQLDRGLYGALIIDDPKEPLAYDEEWVVILDDWLDGVTTTPPKMLKELSGGMSDMGEMGGMGGGPTKMGNTLMGANSDLLLGDAGDVFYPAYLINGRPPEDPETYASRPGARVRIRIINAGGDTAFRVALGGHAMTVTHTDGFPVDPFEADSVLVGMGERYDVLVTLAGGAFPFVAEAEGKAARAFAVVRTGGGSTPPPDAAVAGLTGRVATADQLTATDAVTLPSRKVDRELRIELRGSMEMYDWSLDGQRFDLSDPLANVRKISQDERIRLDFVNTTEMWHPMHLHGHTFQHAGGGPRKDTSIVLPGRTLSVDFDADNPGRWLMHCHNIYHGEAGMMGVVAYAE